MPNEKPKDTKERSSLVDLDDPLDEVEIVERAPDTKRPEYDSSHFAQHVETAEDRATIPPSPTYDMLRDSCKTLAAADSLLDDDAGGSGVHPTESPAAKAARAVIEADEAKRRATAKK